MQTSNGNASAFLLNRFFILFLLQNARWYEVVAMVWQGLNVVKTGRVMLGETNPADSKPGTIRGDYCIQIGRNICHGSDSVESAKKVRYSLNLDANDKLS